MIINIDWYEFFKRLALIVFVLLFAVFMTWVSGVLWPSPAPAQDNKPTVAVAVFCDAPEQILAVIEFAEGGMNAADAAHAVDDKLHIEHACEPLHAAFVSGANIGEPVETKHGTLVVQEVLVVGLVIGDQLHPIETPAIQYVAVLIKEPDSHT